jgi:aromatic ring-cleaving dioxygenase
MTEIGGNAAVYFDPIDEVRAAEIIWKKIQNNGDIQARGYHNIKQYSTMTMIMEYVDCYKLVTMQ